MLVTRPTEAERIFFKVFFWVTNTLKRIIV
jgi:hypothetical protein